MHTLTHEMGGVVVSSGQKEFGFASVDVPLDNPLLPAGTYQVWMSHGDRLEGLPDGFVALASSGNSPFAVMGNEERKIYGVQFHPEVRHTPIGKTLLANFVLEICAGKPDWTPESIIAASVTQIHDQMGDARVLSAVSGGVDSSVATALFPRR